MKEIKLFINGEFKAGSEGKTFDSLDPSSGEVVAKCHLPSTKDIDEAIDAAEAAFYNPTWKNMTAEKRAEILLKVSELLTERRREFVDLEIKDSGSVVRKAKADIHNASSYFKVMSKTAAKFNFLEQDERASREGFSKNFRSYEPVGVCAQVIPWNFPLVMAAWKIGPILATGCTTVLKTAKETPVTAILLAEVLKEAGVPDGVVNIVTGDAPEGSYLVNHPKVSKVAFTGSTEVGQKIYQAAAPHIKNLSLELGGKSPNIILDDADIDAAVDGALYAFLYHSGQACDSGTRLLVQAGIYDQFMERFKARAADVKVGPTSDKDAGYGPVVSEKQFKTIMGFIDKTKSEGAPLLFGGEKLSGGDFDKGHFVAPTAFEITPDNTIFHEEIFGPVVGVTKFKTEKEAIQLANNSRYGLAGAVWSKDHDRAREIALKLETGTVWINEYHLLNPGMPFGGYKQSGISREMGREGMLAYLEVKHLWESDCDPRDKKPWFDAIF